MLTRQELALFLVALSVLLPASFLYFPNNPPQNIHLIPRGSTSMDFLFDVYSLKAICAITIDSIFAYLTVFVITNNVSGELV